MRTLRLLPAASSCLAIATLLLFSARPVPADTIMQVGSPGAMGANDTLNWTFSIPSGNPISATSPNRVHVTVSEPSSTFSVVCEAPAVGCSWVGNFASGTIIVNDQFPNGPVTFTFNHPVQGFGLSVDNAFGNSFTGTITVFNGATQLGTYTSPTTSGLLFLGLLDTTGTNITSAVVSTHDISVPSGEDNYFASGV